ncbi:MAG: outer membrane beta-barrel protein, partial [Sphingobacteriia bacterium]
MKSVFLFLALILSTLRAQDSTLHISAYLDGYYGYDIGHTLGRSRPYFYVANQHNNFNLNLLALKLTYSADRYRLQATPAFGTYMAANYAAEPAELRYLVDAYGGLRLHNGIWLDAGILPSPFGYEGALSHDLPTYTRSFSAENSPYYLAGARLTLPLGERLTGYAYMVNGWQNIRETNDAKSFIGQLQYKNGDRLLLNASTYVGNEQTTDSLSNRMRYFVDLYAYWAPSDKFSILALFDVGSQQDKIAPKNPDSQLWHTANCITSYRWAKEWRSSLRAEYYNDPKAANLASATASGPGVEVYGGSLGLDYMPT